MPQIHLDFVACHIITITGITAVVQGDRETDNVMHYQYQSQIYLARAKTQSEARLESEMLLVHVMVEVVRLQMRLETRKCIALS